MFPRVGDIWRAYWLQPLLWLLNGRIAFLTSDVLHVRNAHDYHADFIAELPLYRRAGEYVTLVQRFYNGVEAAVLTSESVAAKEQQASSAAADGTLHNATRVCAAFKRQWDHDDEPAGRGDSSSGSGSDAEAAYDGVGATSEHDVRAAVLTTAFFECVNAFTAVLVQEELFGVADAHSVALWLADLAMMGYRVSP